MSPDLRPEDIRQRYALLCRSTRMEPDEKLLAYGVEQGLDTLEKLIENDLRNLARKGAPNDFADIYLAMQCELERFRQFCAYPALAQRFVVAFGGGFSAGKSSLINALLGKKLLATEVDPTTSLPTWLLHGDSNDVCALNLFGHRIGLSADELLSLTHDEPLLYGSNISRLLRAAFITRTDFAWPNLALIDTPGYSKDQSNDRSERTDEHIARAQLNAAQAVVWVIDARQGCITEDDLSFLGSLQRNIPLFIAISRADQKPEAEIPGILSVIAAALQARDIPVVGMAAFSARKPRAWPFARLVQQLENWNRQRRELRFFHNFKAEFARYDRYLMKKQANTRANLGCLNRILALSESSDAEGDRFKGSIQTELSAIKAQRTQLEKLWQTCFDQLQELGAMMGMESSNPSPWFDQKAEPGDILLDGDGYPELVVLPGGSFEMGSTDDISEQPVHTVSIASFAMGKYPVTQTQWVTVMGDNPSYFSDNGDCPVENVSWDDAQAFIQKLNQLTGHTYRLPSEAEWEYACRAGSKSCYCFGDAAWQLSRYAWFDENSGPTTHPVGKKTPNAFGLHDMLGNVWEWCEDVWHDDYQNAPADGTARVVGWDPFERVLRGSSWLDAAVYLRSSNRNANYTGTKFDNIGFRLARTLP